MNSSASKQNKGILFDTNVLSLLARINRLELLFQTFADAYTANQFYVSPTIRLELQAGLRNGAIYIEKPLYHIDTGDIQVVHLTDADRLFVHALPEKLGAGEAEAIALCNRLRLIFISHDRKAINYCVRVGIPSIKFVVLVERLRQASLLSEAEINEMFM